MRFYLAAALLALLIGLAAGITNRIKSLSQTNQQLEVSLAHVQQVATIQTTHLNQLVTNLEKERQSYAQLQTTQQQLQASHLQRTQQLNQLARENEELKNWTSVHLPTPVSRLRNRPAITALGDYNNWLPSSNPLPTARQQPSN